MTREEIRWFAAFVPDGCLRDGGVGGGCITKTKDGVSGKIFIIRISLQLKKNWRSYFHHSFATEIALIVTFNHFEIRHIYIYRTCCCEQIILLNAF